MKLAQSDRALNSASMKYQNMKIGATQAELYRIFENSRSSQNGSSASRKAQIDLGPLAFDSGAKVGTTNFSCPPPPGTGLIFVANDC